MRPFSCVVVGDESLLIQCSELLRERGHTIAAVVTGDAAVTAWAADLALHVEKLGHGLAERLRPIAFDWLFSIANLAVIPDSVLKMAARGSINFHDGPLPRYAGLNTPVWAIINREQTHGVTWHMMETGVDEGDIVEQQLFEISDETALTLNTRCYAAGLESFGRLVGALEDGGPTRRRQDLSQRSFFGHDARPDAAARLDFSRDAEDLVALVRGLDHGDYWNPIAHPKIEVGGQLLLVRAAEMVAPTGATAGGTVIDVTQDRLIVATGTSPIALGGLMTLDGEAIDATAAVSVGDRLPMLDPATAEVLTTTIRSMAGSDRLWRRRLADCVPAVVPQARVGTEAARWQRHPIALPGIAGDRLLSAFAALVARIGGMRRVDLAYRDAELSELAMRAAGYVADWVPVRFDAGPDVSFATSAAGFAETLTDARKHRAFARDLGLRDPAIGAIATPQAGITTDNAGPIPGTCLCLEASETEVALWYDAARLSASDAAVFVDGIAELAAWVANKGDGTTVARLPIMPPVELNRLLHGLNATAIDYDRNATMPGQVEAQVARTPDAVAVVFEAESVTYAELDARANRVAQVLSELGVGPDTLVGLCMPRSLDLLVGALAIHKAGGAYVPLDPGYPADRLAFYISDSAAPVILTRSDTVGLLPNHAAHVLLIDDDPRIAVAPTTPVASGLEAGNLAYVIYTSGSTGRPKGVMIEHRNVANFFAGMDDVIAADPGVWMAVTSLSFDISVLELFWTLSRGFTVVLSGDEQRALVSGGAGVSARRIDFSLFYWGNDAGRGPKKYELLLEGARFADANGFCAVWTPERHFHAFGGPYPNPSVTGAAVAAITHNLSVRAGSCVAPLHHTARIAEEWAVIDNLTNGRAALAIASGWQPDDFVLRPENTPPANKAALYRAIDDLRRLWRGEAVDFPTKDGTPFPVVTQPRPVSEQLPIWVTTAGNPDTWREAGAIGANVLTHLLGQSIDEVSEKIGIYHAALREAGHEPDDFTVTLMLHTFVGADRAAVREAVREPMKDYLRSAAALIKQYAWAFPAFKRPAGATSSMQIDLETLTAAELDSILEFAFARYFDDSGLFGTIDECLVQVERLKRIGVDEIACLIDYGIPVSQVLEGLRPLAEVLRRANAPAAAPESDFSIAAQLIRHNVTHLQCTPSMARMIVANEEARAALGRVQRLMIGGEPLPGNLVAELAQVTGARIENMYGPTETTIWSSTAPATSAESVVSIGTPIANTQFYVLDQHREPVPVGVPGELWIGGDGVARGYLRRPDLTGERFAADPFVRPEAAAPWGARMYRTGDVVRWRGDGKLDFVGRVDHQVKVRGYRIELGEIEAALEACPEVRQAVVAAREDTPGNQQLVAYLVLNQAVESTRLSSGLAARLPDYMVPSHFVILTEFPLTPNRKVDRNALPPPDAAKASRADTFVAPVNDIERRIAEIWSRVLGVAQVGSKDNFFALGGHSLLAVQAHREIRDALRVPTLSITDIFRYPTLASLAVHVDPGVRAAGVAPVDTARLAERSQARTEALSRRRALRADRLSRQG